MPELDMKWVKEQIQAAKVRKPVGNAVVALVESLESMELTPDMRKKAVELFSHLSLGHSVVKETKNEVWVQARPGQIKVGDQVRVRSSAFDGRLGSIHNGRKGVVVAIRYGDIIIKTNDGREPQLDGAHYPPQSLEKLVSK